MHMQFRRLPEIQQRPEWRRFLDGCPRDRRFPVVIATRRSSRTLLDLRPLEVCALREVVLTQAATFSGILDVTLSQTQVEENSLLHVIGVHHL